MDFGCISIIGIVDKFSEKLYAFCIEAFADRDNMSFVDSDF